MRRHSTIWVAVVPLLILLGLVVADAIRPNRHANGKASSQAAAQTARSGDSPADREINNVRDLNNVFVSIAETASPAVVTVFTERVLTMQQSPFFDSPFEEFFRDFFQRNQQQMPGREFRQQGLGSGVVVSADGYIITNNHVIANADTINVRFLDERTVSAKVVGADPRTDVAVIKVQEKNLPTLRFGDSDKLRVGEWVLAVGSPLSPNLAHSVTTGIVSAKGRSNVGLADYEDFIQTDAAINPGNSGGALVNIDGDLIGINTAIASQSGGYQGVGFAVPSNMAQMVMQSLIEHGKVTRGWLGVYIQEIDESMAEALDADARSGVLVADVTEKGPSDKAGLEPGDIIVALEGKPVTSSTVFRNEIARKAPGSTVKLNVIRDGKKRDISVKLEELPSDEVLAQRSQRSEEQLGMSVAPLDEASARRYGIRRAQAGVVITSITPGSQAQRAGLQEGDLIVEVDREPVRNLSDFNARIRDAERGSAVLLRIVREERSFFVSLRS